MVEVYMAAIHLDPFEVLSIVILRKADRRESEHWVFRIRVV